MKIFRINGKERYTTVKDLKKLLFENMKKRKQVRVYWKGCSESARLHKGGTVKAIGRVGGRNLDKHIIYEDFEKWFKESIIKENSIDITLKLETN